MSVQNGRTHRRQMLDGVLELLLRADTRRPTGTTNESDGSESGLNLNV